MRPALSTVWLELFACAVGEPKQHFPRPQIAHRIPFFYVQKMLDPSRARGKISPAASIVGIVRQRPSRCGNSFAGVRDFAMVTKYKSTRVESSTFLLQQECPGCVWNMVPTSCPMLPTLRKSKSMARKTIQKQSRKNEWQKYAGGFSSKTLLARAFCTRIDPRREQCRFARDAQPHRAWGIKNAGKRAVNAGRSNLLASHQGTAPDHERLPCPHGHSSE
ncbi:MAG: hypothetical protein ONB48_05975 [candidate division KSB1 bacterium]|nr:hypothetical protein [candidate division KSB1 bacterium]MDZ7273094.1 hypothetical protein [candidate division KSB1 bacterium]MDZ7285197.1 hypothetical protein [candidate division KSB1 bacterium]MDZ7298229.1 hypothetical protein [candidate division KSB1 bacterium]MDZ7306731.1 hypothetical protein [candidate division KSB1 bacterium]